MRIGSAGASRRAQGPALRLRPPGVKVRCSAKRGRELAEDWLRQWGAAKRARSYGGAEEVQGGRGSSKGAGRAEKVRGQMIGSKAGRAADGRASPPLGAGGKSSAAGRRGAGELMKAELR